MFQRFSKISLIVLLLSSSCLYSCDEGKDDVDPSSGSCSKEMSNDLSKTETDNILKNNRWKVKDHNSNDLSQRPMSGLHFKVNNKVDVYYADYDTPFNNSTVVTKDYTIADDAKTITIGKKEFDIKKLSDTDAIIEYRNDEFILVNKPI